MTGLIVLLLVWDYDPVWSPICVDTVQYSSNLIDWVDVPGPYIRVGDSWEAHVDRSGFYRVKRNWP